MKIRTRIVLAAISTIILIASLWQIEYIISCAENGWIYDAPFHLFQCDIWVAHDLWYTILGIGWLIAMVDAFIEEVKDLCHRFNMWLISEPLKALGGTSKGECKQL